MKKKSAQQLALEWFDSLILNEVIGKFSDADEAIIKTIRQTLSAPRADGWIDLVDAPLGIEGHVWSPDRPERVDFLGTVFEYKDKSRGVAANANGFKFTKWHALPDSPETTSERGGG